MKKIKNIDTIDHVWGGMGIAAGEIYSCINDKEAIAFAQSDLFISDLVANKAQVYSDTNLIIGVGPSLVFLNSNFVSLDVPKTTAGIQKVSLYEPEGEAASIVTHNFADKCSWYSGSVQVVDDALVVDSGFTYKSTNGKTHWIDLTHGRCYDEDNIMSQNANKWALKVYVDGVLKTEDLWFKAAEGDLDASMIKDYSVDYENGKITFHSEPVGAVTASYSYAVNSYYIIKPKVGKILAIKAAEVQFSQGTLLKAPFLFEAWVNHPVYGLIPVPGTQIAYKNFKDFISACNEGQGLIPKVGELTQDIHVFPFNYARPKPLKYSQGVEIRVYCKNHIPCSGEYATATFYVTVDPEVI